LPETDDIAPFLQLGERGAGDGFAIRQVRAELAWRCSRNGHYPYLLLAYKILSTTVRFGNTYANVGIHG
jgi:hypothetical protein